MLTVEAALEIVRTTVGPPAAAAERVPLAESLDRVLLHDVAMDHDVPPFRRATMDGFAVADAGARGTRYAVVGRVLAGETPVAPVGGGEAVRVMTGAPVPPGTRRVIPFEATGEREGSVLVTRDLGAGSNVVEPGAHVQAGAVVLGAGARLSPAAVGVLAAAGVERVEVAARPRVAVLGTGSELVAVAQRPGPAQIRGSNNPTLAAQAARAGALALDLGLVDDEPRALREALAQGLTHDVLVVSGGVSQGDLDLVPAALAALGVVEAFHGWGVQPGGPLWFGARGRTLVFALPGNPAAAFVGFELLAVPALRARQGRPFAARRTLRASWDGPDPGPYPRRRFRPATLGSDADGGLWVKPGPWKGSGDPFSLAAAEALVELPEAGLAQDGTGSVKALPLGGEW